MELNGETFRFIREHRKDDVRSLAPVSYKHLTLLTKRLLMLLSAAVV